MVHEDACGMIVTVMFLIFELNCGLLDAEVAELVDAPVSNTGGCESMPVRFRPSVPYDG